MDEIWKRKEREKKSTLFFYVKSTITILPSNLKFHELSELRNEK